MPCKGTNSQSQLYNMDFHRASRTRSLTSLPPELLESIYHHLDTIDDVHSLGRTHSKTFHVIERQTVYTEIMRFVIGRSWVHRYELQLCSILELHRKIVQHFCNDGGPFPVISDQDHQSYNQWEESLANTTVVPDGAFGPCAACIPDAAVYEILARYQGLRMIEDLWLRRQIEEPDLLAADAILNIDDDEFLRRYRCLLGRSQDFEQGDLASRTRRDRATWSYTKLNPDQRGRLHSAIIFVWILNEIRWVLTNFQYPLRSYRYIELVDKCRSDLMDLSHNPVLDQLDQNAVFSFLSHHLLPLHSPVLPEQNSSKLPFTFTTECHIAGVHWQAARPLRFFLTAGQTYFQPPDLIEFAARHKISQFRPYPDVSLPETTREWMRPAKTYLFPANVALGDSGSSLTQLFNIHVAILNRSPFAQTLGDSYNQAMRRALPTSSKIIDNARRCFRDSAVIAIESDERFRAYLRPARDIFDGEWQNRGLWSVWWWANSEDKARAIITRWREKPQHGRKTNSCPLLPLESGAFH